jgi:ABC-type multidrug transport system ATPase subunit
MPMTPGEARGYLARFLFRGDDAFKEVRSLSGGERSRLELALLGILPSNLLLLDEPTNHLDIPAREAIETFLADTGATLIVVSHDRRLLETICERLWVVDAGVAVPFEGGYKTWRAAVADGWTTTAEAERQTRRLRPGLSGSKGVTGSAAGGNGTASARPGAGPSQPAPTAPAVKTKLATAARAPKPKLSKEAYRRRRETLDTELSRLATRKGQLELQLGMPSVGANFVELRRVTSELADVEAALAAAEDAWLELEEQAP